jgi:hypothetical protein
VGEDPELDQLFLRLCVEVNKEVKFMDNLMEMQVSYHSPIIGVLELRVS